MSYVPAPMPGAPIIRPDHPRATTALVLGILGLVICSVCAPFAWSIGRKTVKEIDAGGGAYGGRGQAQAGYICGIIGTVILAVGVLALLFWLVVVVIFGIAGFSSQP